MKENYITLTVADGTEMQAYVSRPKGEVKGGVIVLQEAFGVNDYIRRVADRIAEQGYVTVAPELFHRSSPGFSPVDAPIEEIMPLIQALKVDEIENDVRAAHAWLAQEEGVVENMGIIGFCMGGRSTFIANSVLPFKAAISLYGGGIAEGLLDRVPNLSAPMLFFWGGADLRIPRETWSQIPKAMDEAGKAHIDVEFSGAEHAYLTDDRSSYDKNASELTWPLILDFFKQKLV
jgi:carboxymethylenebutenolidase